MSWMKIDSIYEAWIITPRQVPPAEKDPNNSYTQCVKGQFLAEKLEVPLDQMERDIKQRLSYMRLVEPLERLRPIERAAITKFAQVAGLELVNADVELIGLLGGQEYAYKAKLLAKRKSSQAEPPPKFILEVDDPTTDVVDVWPPPNAPIVETRQLPDTGSQDPGSQDPKSQDPGVQNPGVQDPTLSPSSRALLQKALAIESAAGACRRAIINADQKQHGRWITAAESSWIQYSQAHEDFQREALKVLEDLPGKRPWQEGRKSGWGLFSFRESGK